MKRAIAILVIAICLVITVYDIGLSTQAKIESPDPTEINSSQATGNKIFRGIVKNLDGGTAVFTDTETYPLIGGDFETLVGKNVNIIGRIVKEGNLKKLRVTLIQFDKI